MMTDVDPTALPARRLATCNDDIVGAATTAPIVC
jgi:hypothetical protein